MHIYPSFKQVVFKFRGITTFSGKYNARCIFVESKVLVLSDPRERLEG